MLVFIFCIGYALIVLEHQIRLNKSASALLTGVMCWAWFILGSNDVEGVTHQLGEVLSKSAEIVFFLLGAMTIVELMDAHNGFDLITNQIKTTNRRKIIWIVALITFFLAAILDTLATIIVVIKLLDNLLHDEDEKLSMSGFAVVAANAGGSWSVIGAPTTTMLWIGKQVSVDAVAASLFLPCFLSILLVLMVYQFRFPKESAPSNKNIAQKKPVTNSEQGMFVIGILALLFVPIFKTITHLPPYMGMMLSLALVWIASEIIHHKRDEEDKRRYSVGAALSKIETPSLLFFLGILLAVGALEVTGSLASVAAFLENTAPNKTLTVSIIGVLSAIVDNIPLTAATMGMYPLSAFPTNDNLWLLTAYCVGTGGSILVIGSAAGVAAMGMRKSMNFFWYIKNTSLWALLAYIIGILLFLLFHQA